MSDLCAVSLRALALALCASASFAQEQPDVVLRGGRLFDGVGDDLVPNTALVIQDGRFAAIGTDPGGSDLAGATVIELAPDDTILPGMFDLHAHYAVDLFDAGRAGRVDERTVMPVLFLANGVTNTYTAGEVNAEEMRELRLAIERGETVGPRLYNSGPYFGSWRRGWDADISLEALAAEVDLWAGRGVHCFKAKGIRPEHLAVLIERAHHHELQVTGHLDSGFRDTVNPRDAIAMGIDRVEHFLGGDAMPPDRPAYSSLQQLDQDSVEFAASARLFIEHGVYFDATLSAYGYYGGRDPDVFTYFIDEKAFLTPYMRGLVEARPARPVLDQFSTIYWVKRQTLKKFHELGGGHLITLGTDHPSWGEFLAGFSVHRELQCFVGAGLSPADALKCATINGARALGVDDELGTIEPGKLADFLVVRGDPLADIRATRSVHTVGKAGRVFRTQELLDSVRGRLGPAGADDEGAWKPRR